MSPNRSRAALIRDAALQRVRRTRRWVLVATAGLTAGFAALVSAVAPGRSLAAKTSSAGASSATASVSGSSAIPAMPPAANGSALGLQGPDQAPSPGSGDSQPSQPSQPQSSAPSQSQSAPSQPAPQPSAPPVTSGGS